MLDIKAFVLEWSCSLSFVWGFFFPVFAFDVQIIKNLYIFTVALKSVFKRNTKRIAISIFIVRLSRVNNYNFELESFGHVLKMMMYICIKMSYVKYSKI